MPFETCQAFYSLLDDVDPLGRDYRALAEILGIPEQTVKQIQEFSLRKPSMTESILLVNTLISICKKLLHAVLDLINLTELND